MDRTAPRIIFWLYKSCTAVTPDNKETRMERVRCERSNPFNKAAKVNLGSKE